MLTNLATFIHANGRRVLLVALLAAAIAGVFGFGVAKHMSPYGADDPATQSVQATNRFEAAAGPQDRPRGRRARERRRRPQPRGRAARRAGRGRLRAEPRRRERGQLLRHPRPRDGLPRRALDLRRRVLQAEIGHADARRRTADGGSVRRPARRAARRRAIANAQANTQVGHDLARAELLAFPFIFLLSLLFFRSLVASLLPPLLGGLAILATFFALRIVSSFTDLSVFALNLVTGLGPRARDRLQPVHGLPLPRGGRDVRASASRRCAARSQTAGRTILFSSLTVAAAVASLAIFPQRFLYSMGIAGAVVALVAATLALVVLPALLAVLGPRVNALAPKRLQRAADRDARPAQSGVWYRLSRFVMRRPGRIAVLSAALLIALGIPFTGIKFVSVNASVLPHSASARQVDDTLAHEFPPDSTSPVEVVVGAPASSPQVRPCLRGSADCRTSPRSRPRSRPGAQTSLLDVAPVAATAQRATKQLVRDIRAIRSARLRRRGRPDRRLPRPRAQPRRPPAAVLAVIIAATLIVLFLFTGSVVLPLKAVLMNVLSLSAVLGILVLIFQDGRLQGLLSYTSQGALDATQPIFLAAVAFGLATDYGVFLLSRIKEARDSGISDSEAVAVGLERTGRIVTAAARPFAVAIGAFATSKLVFIKELGLGTHSPC